MLNRRIRQGKLKKSGSKKRLPKSKKAKNKQRKFAANLKNAAKKPRKEQSSDANNSKKREESDYPRNKCMKRQKSGDDTKVQHFVQKLSLLPDTVLLRMRIVYLL